MNLMLLLEFQAPQHGVIARFILEFSENEVALGAERKSAMIIHGRFKVIESAWFVSEQSIKARQVEG